MKIYTNVKLNVSRLNVLKGIFAKQFDTNSRYLDCAMFDDRKMLHIDHGDIVVNAIRADGAYHSFAGSINDNGTVRVPIANWMLAVAGKLTCSVSVYDGNEKLTSASFELTVEVAENPDQVVSEDDPGVITVQELIEQATDAKNTAVAAAEAAETVLETFSGDVDQAVADWLDNHPEATTTVNDGAITNNKLAPDLQNIIGIESMTGELFAETDWTYGYIGANRVTISETPTTNGDMITQNPAQVRAGDTISVTVAIPTDKTYAYLYYVYVTSASDLTYVGSRFGGSSKYNSSDENYRYYSVTIDVIEDGYIIFSYRPQGADIEDSHFLGASTTNNITKLQRRMTAAERGISANADAITALANSTNGKFDEVNANAKLYNFPADDMFPINICHRGLATSGLPENTMVAFKDAVSKGWKFLETDIRSTSDGVWVLLHDSTINRTARNADGTTISGDVSIGSITYAQALEYDFGIKEGATYAGTKIPTLDAFLNYCNKAHVYPVLEVKNSSITQEEADAVWAIVEKYGMQNRIMWLCSSLGGVEKFLAKNPYAPAIQTSASAWTPVDISTLTPSSEKPYATKYLTGKNKAFHERSVSGIDSKSDMDNLLDYYRYFGVYGGVYCPTTVAGIEDCSDRLDMCTTQYYSYSEVKKDEIE